MQKSADVSVDEPPMVNNEQSPLLQNERQLKNQTNVQQMNIRQNIHKMNQFNKLSPFVRAASEPPQPIRSVINSKSIILPVKEVNENRHDNDFEENPFDMQGCSKSEIKRIRRESN